MNTKSYLQKRKKKWKKKSGRNERNRKEKEKQAKINEIVKEKWWIVNVEQNSPKQLLQKKTLKNQNKPRKKPSEQIVLVGLWVSYFLESQNLTVLRGISEKGRKGRKMLQVGLCGSVLRLWVRKLAGRYTMIMTDMSSCPVESSKRQTAGWWWEQYDDGRKRVKTAKTGVFFVFGDNFKMLNVVICVLRHFLGDW